MRRLAWVLVPGLAAVVPAVAFETPVVRPVQPQFVPPGGPLPGFGEPVPVGNYVAPKADGPVVELLDENIEPLFPQLINDGGAEPGTIAREDRDVFAGVEAARVTPLQKYRSNIPGWGYKIVEKPKNAGDFRFLRFAWKKIGGSGIMIQLHDPQKSWAFRYFAGANVQNWQPATQVAPRLSGDWEIYTVDLFTQFGAINLTGIALTPLDGTAGLFDHILLGRSTDDLDRHTRAALGKVKPAKALDGKERDAQWAGLLAVDVKKSSPAFRAFLASAPDQVAFVREKLGAVAKDDKVADVQKLIADLGAESFDTRDAAAEQLVKLGPAAVEPVRGALSGAPNDEVRFRCRTILRRLGATPGASGPPTEAARLSRVVRVLERAATPDARALLTDISEGRLAPAAAADAKSALARLAKAKP
jgi:hypothetical protein